MWVEFCDFIRILFIRYNCKYKKLTMAVFPKHIHSLRNNPDLLIQYRTSLKHPDFSIQCFSMVHRRSSYSYYYQYLCLSFNFIPIFTYYAVLLIKGGPTQPIKDEFVLFCRYRKLVYIFIHQIHVRRKHQQ